MNLINPIKSFFRNQSNFPFGTVFAFFCAYSGLAGLLRFGIVNDVFSNTLGSFLANIFNVMFLLSGVAMFTGLGLLKRNIEAFGLITIATSLMIRNLVLGWVLGFSPLIFNAYVLNIAFTIACLVRTLKLYKKKETINVQIGIDELNKGIKL